MKFAEVAVNVRLRRRAEPDTVTTSPGTEIETLGDTFHYRVPEALAGRVAAGHLVVVPFGPARTYGIVVALTDTAPVEELKEIEALALPDPVVTPTQMALAQWMRDEYLTTLTRCLYAMLPPGLIGPARIFYRLTVPEEALPGRLTGPARAVAGALAREGSLRVTQLQRRLKLKRRAVRRALAQLRRRRLVASEPVLPPLGGQTRRVRFVRLLAGDDTIAAARPHLGHDSAQARVLHHLAATSDPLPTLADVCAAADCSSSPVQALARRGWLSVTPKQETLVPLLPADELDRLADEKAERASRQSALLRYLSDHPGPVEWNKRLREATSATAGTVRALEEAGIVRRVAQEPTVLLCLSPEEAQAHALELRGGVRQAAVLDLLHREGDQVWVSWLYAETGCSLDDLRRLEELGLVELAEAEVWRDPLAGKTFVAQTPPTLTSDQLAVWNEIQNLKSKIEPAVFLLHGVTGSGKTEIYLRALAEVLAQSQRGIILVPEISLTPQTVRRFVARFPGRVAVYHSALSSRERYDVWRRVRDGLVDIVVGPRSALFLPLPRLGLIVLDEEHSASYKQPRVPHYHARDVAIHLARVAGATVILGSATPDLTSYHRAEQGRYRLLNLPQRILAHQENAQFAIRNSQLTQGKFQALADSSEGVYAEMPPVEVVDLRDELRAGNRSIFSRALQRALTETLGRGQQAILFLNRRGAATFVNCRDCGHVLQCSRCDVSLTYHSSDNMVVCHHCSRRSSPPDVCPACGGTHMRYFGVGTQRVEAAMRERFPSARVLRWDRDTTGSRWGHEKFLQAFLDHQADVLVGTQMVAKGLDLPLVTLVGVVAADTALHLPDFRAAERTFQLLAQVAGRAGRSPLGGRVIVQTYAPDAYAVAFAARHDYESFYRREIAFRGQAGYPPFLRLARLVYAHADPDRCQAQAEAMYRMLEYQIARLGLPDVGLIGPAPCFVTRKRGRYWWQIVVRAARPQDLLRYVSLPLGWQVDIDPVSLL
ncbi:MAG: primosomal protein N' [Anaerolineae bacterium]|nr:MAG: primosomal protein N' [Anaerolineae bacterium]